MRATQDQVRQFLLEFKQAAERNINFLDRQKNFEFLLEHGMSTQERRDILLGLQVSDYSAGPEVDEMFPKQPPCVWMFGVERDSIPIYIKIKLVKDGETVRAKCLSFHQAEFTMRFPYRR